MEKDRFQVKIHSSVAQMTYKLDHIAIKTWFYLIARIFNLLDKKENQIFYIPSKDLFEYLGTKNFTHIKETLDTIRKTGVSFNVLGKNPDKDWIITSLLSTVGIKNGEVIFEIPVFLREKLLEYRKMFVVINLMLIRDFSTKYSLSLYIILSDYLISNIDQTEKIFTVDELKTVLGLDKNEYPEYKIFNRDVLKRAVSEINEKSSLIVEYKAYKVEKRKVYSLKFTFRLKKELGQTLYLGRGKGVFDPELKEEEEEKLLYVAHDNALNTSGKIFPENKKVLDFILKNKIVLTSPKNQERMRYLLDKLETIKNLDKYFLYLMDVVQNKQDSIKEDFKGDKNIGGFFIGIFNSDAYFEGFSANSNKEKDKKDEYEAKFLEYLNKEIEQIYNIEMKKQFFDYFDKNYNKYKNTVKKLIDIFAIENSFFRNEILPRNDNKIDMKLLKSPMVSNLLFSKRAEHFDYDIPITFDYWLMSFSDSMEGIEIIEKIKIKVENDLRRIYGLKRV